jgi:hypothetical protein
VLNHPKYLDLLNQKDNVEHQISLFMEVVVSGKEELAKCKQQNEKINHCQGLQQNYQPYLTYGQNFHQPDQNFVQCQYHVVMDNFTAQETAAIAEVDIKLKHEDVFKLERRHISPSYF